jgi:hypothetical protein
MGALAHARWLETQSWTAWAAMAVCLAVAWCTKFTAVLLFVPWVALTLIRVRGAGERAKAVGLTALTLLPAMALLIACYPLLWWNTMGELRAMFALALQWNRNNAFTGLYFGEVTRHTELPWHFPFVILGITVPGLVFLLALWGLAKAPGGPLPMMARVHVAFWILLFMAGLAPRYDNERQLVPILPFVALSAGLGLQKLCAWVKTRGWDRVRRAVMPAVAAYSLVTLLTSLPFPLSYFSELIGGVRGATRAGFEATYLMEVVTRPLLDEWTRDLPQDAALAIRPNSDLGTFYRARGWLRKDIRADPAGPFVLVVWRSNGEGFTDDLFNAKRLRDLTIDGVSLATLFSKRPAHPGVGHAN